MTTQELINALNSFNTFELRRLARVANLPLSYITDGHRRQYNRAELIAMLRDTIQWGNLANGDLRQIAGQFQRDRRQIAAFRSGW